MLSSLAIGGQAQVVPPKPIVGTITDVTWNKDAAEPQILLTWNDPDDAPGESHSRWFSQSELEDVV